MKTAGAAPRADKQKAESVFQPGKLPLNAVIYTLNHPVSRGEMMHISKCYIWKKIKFAFAYQDLD